LGGQREKGATMASEDEVWVQLATRIPKQLHRELKLHCVKADVSLMDFVVGALEDKLQRETRSRVSRRSRS
jgi:predicted HicB family RNase H-like nuclease